MDVTATIQGQHFFHSALPEVWLLFEGGHYSRAAFTFNRGNIMRIDPDSEPNANVFINNYTLLHVCRLKPTIQWENLAGIKFGRH